MADEEEELGTSGHEVEHPPMAGGAGEKGDDEESRVRRSLMLRSAVCREGTVQRADHSLLHLRDTNNRVHIRPRMEDGRCL